MKMLKYFKTPPHDSDDSGEFHQELVRLRKYEEECTDIAKYIQCTSIEVHAFLVKHEWSYLSLYYYASRHGKFPDTT